MNAHLFQAKFQFIRDLRAHQNETVHRFFEKGDPLLQHVHFHIGEDEALVDLLPPVPKLRKIVHLFDLESVFLQDPVQAETHEFILVENEGVPARLLHVDS